MRRRVPAASRFCSQRPREARKASVAWGPATSRTRNRPGRSIQIARQRTGPAHQPVNVALQGVSDALGVGPGPEPEQGLEDGLAARTGPVKDNALGKAVDRHRAVPSSRSGASGRKGFLSAPRPSRFGMT